MTKTSQWKLIAGRGALGDMNWGAAVVHEKDKMEKQYDELMEHLGETVLLTGGGGFGAHTAVLEKAELIDRNNAPHFKNEKNLDEKVALKAYLTSVNPPLAGETTFDPWIDSWQISVLVENQSK